MSRENVELVRTGFGAWNAGDMDALRELYHPEVIMRSVDGWPEPGPFVGREDVMRQFERMRETWDADTIDLIGDFADAADRVAVRMSWRGVGHGFESNMELTYVGALRDGKVFGVEFFWDHAEALEVLGLSEQPMSGNVELAHRIFDAFNRRDLDAMLELTDDDVEAIPRMASVEGVYHGHDGVRRWWEDVFDVFPDFTAEVVEVQDLGDLTIAALRYRAHGAVSDIPTEDMVWHAARWLRRKCVWWGAFASRAEAIEAAELQNR